MLELGALFNPCILKNSLVISGQDLEQRASMPAIFTVLKRRFNVARLEHRAQALLVLHMSTRAHALPDHMSGLHDACYFTTRF